MINSYDFFLIIIMTFFGALGSVSLKKSSSKDTKINKYLIGGGVFYCIGAIFNIILLRYIPLTIIFPCNALTYIWTTIMGKYFLKESITIYNISGLIIIGVGLYFLVL